ncbi:MAG: N-6 DNA methylase [Pseudomonadota bacterium]
MPAAPHDLTKRERGQKYASCGRCDLVAFADDSRESHALQVIFEFKEPSVKAGRQQLQRYLASEPLVKMGYWTNGVDSLAVYKSHTNDWTEVPNAPLPQPGDDLTAPPAKPPTWKDLREPTEAQLSAALRRLVAIVVAQDHRSVRREDQLRELLHLMLVKVESDAVASTPSNKSKPVDFRIHGDRSTMVGATAEAVQKRFKTYFTRTRTEVFQADDVDHLRLTDETIFHAVDILAPWRILGDNIDMLAKAFQIFRTRAMKSGEGQFLTPLRVIKPCVMAMEIGANDKVIDPACGSGGFLIEALRQVEQRDFPEEADKARLIRFANDNLYGVDMDPLGVKLTKAMMIAMQGGWTNTLRGDAVRHHLWQDKFPLLDQKLHDPDDPSAIAQQFTVVLTNPPFGVDLKVSANDARLAGYTITQAAAAASRGKNGRHVDLEIGLVYLELAYRLLQPGGRVGIVLPETYFFSHSYRWLKDWLEGRFVLRGMLNIPMEAFEEFCRAKTNFYILQKVRDDSDPTDIQDPSWFSDDEVLVSTASTCGLTKGGRTLPLIDPSNGQRIQVKDPETGENVDAINDALLDDMEALATGVPSDTLRSVPREQVSLRHAVPVYYDQRWGDAFQEEMATAEFAKFTSASIGELMARGLLTVRNGHGSPSQDQRVGDVPYIKVSDLRAGLVNINPTNRVPRKVAERFWRTRVSGLKPFDLLCPERTSKNIGDFCLLMPGQEQVLLTKEVIVLRPGEQANFDPFYLLWAMTLKVVRDQWRRVVFMQTNREDVGKRYLEIQIPVPKSAKVAQAVSAPFRTYYETLANSRAAFAKYLNDSSAHHFFVSGVEPPDDLEIAALAAAEDADVDMPEDEASED